MYVNEGIERAGAKDAQVQERVMVNFRIIKCNGTKQHLFPAWDKLMGPDTRPTLLTLTLPAALPTLLDRPSTPNLDSAAAAVVEAMLNLVLLCSPLQAPATSEAWYVDEEEELRLQSLHQSVEWTVLS